MKGVRCFALVAGLSLLTACATTPTADEADPEQRIADAKARTQYLELLVAEFVPAGDVDDVDQLSTGSLLSCDSGDMWAGGITIRLRPDVRASTALRELGAKAEDAGLQVMRSTSFNGTERVTVSEADGASVLLDIADQSIEGGSFSACFSLPDEFYRGGEFYSAASGRPGTGTHDSSDSCHRRRTAADSVCSSDAGRGPDDASAIPVSVSVSERRH